MHDKSTSVQDASDVWQRGLSSPITLSFSRRHISQAALYKIVPRMLSENVGVESVAVCCVSVTWSRKVYIHKGAQRQSPITHVCE